MWKQCLCRERRGSLMWWRMGRRSRSEGGTGLREASELGIRIWIALSRNWKSTESNAAGGKVKTRTLAQPASSTQSVPSG